MHEISDVATGNGPYELVIGATTSGGGSTSLTTTVVVDGALKLGRFSMAMDDLRVDVGGVPITLERTYDSTSARDEDFGPGWAAELASVRVVTNRALGAGGWANYDTSCTFVSCEVAYASSKAHTATVIWPDGTSEVFDFTPSGPRAWFAISPCGAAPTHEGAATNERGPAGRADRTRTRSR